jgi:phage gp29-like protein
MRIVNMINPAYQLADPGKTKGTDPAQIEAKQGNPNIDYGSGGSVVKDGVITYKLYDEIGATGTKIFSGIIDDEYLKEWKNPIKRCEIVNRMLKSDATVKAIQLVLSLPLESARWSIDIDEDAGDEEREIMDVVDDMIFHEMTIPWQDTLRQILSFLPYGFSVFEKVWARDEQRNMVKLRKLAPRLQSTIKKWFTDETGGLSAIEQRAYYTTGEKTIYKTVVIPVDKLAVFSYRQEGSNFEGESILRAAYKHWFIKDKLYLIQAVGLERHALGIPVITLPRGASPDDKNYAKQIVKSWRAHEEAGAVFPEGVKIENITGTVQSQVLKQAIDHHDAEIAKSVLAQFIQLGTGGQSGSWSLSKDQSDFLLMTLNGIAQYLCDRMTEYVIKPFVKMNWGEKQFYPKMKCEEISKSNNMETLAAIQQLVGLQLIQPDAKMEEWARRVFNIPAKDEPTFEEYMKQMQSQQMMGQMNDANPTPEQGQQVQAPAGNAKQPKQVVQGGPPAAGGGSVKASDRKIFDMKSNIKLSEDYAITNVKSSIQDLIALKEKLVGIGKTYSDDSLESALEEAWDESINDHVPNIVEELQQKFGRLDNREQAFIKNTYIGGLEISKDKMMDYIKKVIISGMSVSPHKLSEPRLSRYAFDSMDTAMGNAVMRGQMDATLGHEMAPMMTTMLEHHDQVDRQMEPPPPPGALHAKAPIFRDTRTGRYKYAKGAMIEGQHVGGQWADIGTGLGVGSTVGIIGIGAVMKAINSEATKGIKKNAAVGNLNFWQRQLIPEGTVGNDIMRKFGFRFDVTDPRVLYKEKPVWASNMFKTDYPSDINSLGLKENLKELGGFEPPIGNHNSFYTELDLAPRLEQLEGMPHIEGEETQYEKIKVKGANAADVSEEARAVRVTRVIDGQRITVRDTMSHAEWKKHNLSVRFGKIVNGEFAENVEHTNFYRSYWDAIFKKAGDTSEDALRVAKGNKIEWDNYYRNRGALHMKSAGYDVYTDSLGTMQHTGTTYSSAQHIPRPTKVLKLTLEELCSKEAPFPTMNPKHGLTDTKLSITNMLELFESHGFKGLDNLDTAKQAVAGEKQGGSRIIKAMQKVEGGLGKTAFISFVALSGTYLLTQLWKNMTKKATRVLQDKVKTSRYDVLSPEQAGAYNAAYEDWRRLQSPTGGQVGRPRTRVEIPQELKRGRGRPALSEAKKEEKRKQKIADLEKQFRKEQEEKAMTGGLPNVSPSY